MNDKSIPFQPSLRFVLHEVSADLQERVTRLILDSSCHPGLGELLDKLIISQSSICLQGEVGTGKMLLARYIHERSGAPGPLVYVNCKVLGEAQLEAELFGNEVSGSRRQGAFETAHRGTLLIESIECMPLRVQARLMHQLEQGTGGWQERSEPSKRSSVRLVIGSTNSLAAAVDAALLRRDLYYRVEVAPVVLSPLRVRLDDLPGLVDFYLRALTGERRIEIDRDGLQVLARHPWRGNLRELESILHRAVLRAESGVIHADLLDILLRDAPGMRQVETLPVSATYLIRLRELVREAFAHERAAIHESVERVLLETAHEYFCGNEFDAARALSISPSHYRRARKKLGI